MWQIGSKPIKSSSKQSQLQSIKRVIQLKIVDLDLDELKLWIFKAIKLEQLKIRALDTRLMAMEERSMASARGHGTQRPE